MINVQTAQVGELSEILVLQGSDAEVMEAKSDQAAQVGQCLTGDGCQVAVGYFEVLQSQQSCECLEKSKSLNRMSVLDKQYGGI